jgi:hypothetical protein
MTGNLKIFLRLKEIYVKKTRHPSSQVAGLLTPDDWR